MVLDIIEKGKSFNTNVFKLTNNLLQLLSNCLIVITDLSHKSFGELLSSLDKNKTSIASDININIRNGILLDKLKTNKINLTNFLQNIIKCSNDLPQSWKTEYSNLINNTGNETSRSQSIKNILMYISQYCNFIDEISFALQNNVDGIYNVNTLLSTIFQYLDQYNNKYNKNKKPEYITFNNINENNTGELLPTVIRTLLSTLISNDLQDQDNTNKENTTTQKNNIVELLSRNNDITNV